MMKAMKPQGYNVRLLDLPNHANSDEVAKEFMVCENLEKDNKKICTTQQKL